MTDGHPDRTGMAEPVHIRKKAGRSLARPGYSHRHVALTASGYRDPMAETLSGAKATTMDQPVNASATNHLTADGNQHRTARTATP